MRVRAWYTHVGTGYGRWDWLPVSALGDYKLHRWVEMIATWAISAAVVVVFVLVERKHKVAADGDWGASV